MEKENLLTKLYKQPETLTDSEYSFLVKTKNFADLQKKTHYYICAFLQDMNCENLEDAMSDAYLAIFNFITAKKFPKTREEYIEKVARFVFETFEATEMYDKEHNQDLNFEKKVPFCKTEQEIASPIDFEEQIALKLDTEKTVKEFACHAETHTVRLKRKRVISQYFGLDGNTPQSTTKIAKEEKNSTGRISLYIRMFKRYVKSYENALLEYNKQAKESYEKTEAFEEEYAKTHYATRERRAKDKLYHKNAIQQHFNEL